MVHVVFHVVLLMRSLFAPDSIRSLPCASAKSKIKVGAHSMLARWVFVISSIRSGMLLSRPARCCIATGDVPLPVLYRSGCPQTPAFALRTSDLPVPEWRDPMCHTKPSYSVNRINGAPNESKHTANAVSMFGLLTNMVCHNSRHLSILPAPDVLRLMFSRPGIGTRVSPPSLLNTRWL